MSQPASPSPHSLTTGPEQDFRRARLMGGAAAFILSLAVSFLLRILYAGHLYEDDGLWFTAAEEILRGKALYGEIYFDKPPAIALLYALLFKLFGVHIIVVRIFTILYAATISLFLYWFGSLLYERRVGLLAGIMFAIFSTTHATGHMQGLNTDFLMVGPYTLSALLFVGALANLRPSSGRTLALLAGLAAGVAFQINSKAILNLLFFTLVVGLTRWRRERVSWWLTVIAAVGFALGSLPFLAYVALIGSMPEFSLYVWQWGARYAGHLPLATGIQNGVMLTLSYFSLNNTLLLTLAFLVFVAIKNRGLAAEHGPAGSAGVSPARLANKQHSRRDACAPSRGWSDSTLLLWGAISYLGVAIGGRFYAHYFFQLLPALCLIGSRGLLAFVAAALNWKPAARRAAFAFLLLGFAFTLVRFHGRTVILGLDRFNGLMSEATREWRSEVLNREERMVAAVVREIPDGPEVADRIGLEEIRASGLHEAGGREAEDYLFVWGYRPEIYYWSGLLPASRYLSTQPLTGVPADVHYINGERRSILDDGVTSPARAELASELRRTRPRYIIDELGFFNAALAIDQYPELQDIMSEYKNLGATGRFFVYRRRDAKRKVKPSVTGMQSR